MAEEDRQRELREAALRVARQRFRERAESAFIDQVVSWLVDKWGKDKPCPYCGHDHWTVGPAIDAPGWQGTGSRWFMPVTCDNCAQSTLIDVVAAGLTPSDDDEEET